MKPTKKPAATGHPLLVPHKQRNDWPVVTTKATDNLDIQSPTSPDCATVAQPCIFANQRFSQTANSPPFFCQEVTFSSFNHMKRHETVYA